jgi:ATP-dependent RNA helicase DDX56/DBP9
MKRKMDENDNPVPADPPKNENANPNEASFADLDLDSRLYSAISRQNYIRPTLIQAKAIPLIIEGNDVLAKAKTSSGKTAAYVLPILQAILKRKQTNADAYTAALVLVPTRELADQVSKVFEAFSSFCAKHVHIVKLSDKLSDSVQRSLLSASPEVIVATPARAWQAIKSSALSLDSLTHLILDEADLVMSYGYEDDLKSVASSLPKSVQTVLMSATLTAEVDNLSGLLCRNPKVLDLEEPDAEGEGVSQYVVK